MTTGEQTEPLTLKRKFRRWFFEGMRPSAKVRDEKIALVLRNVPDRAGLFRQSWLRSRNRRSVSRTSGTASHHRTCVAHTFGRTSYVQGSCRKSPHDKVVAEKSPHGQGSIAMLEELVPGWMGKVVILCLLGFAATDFIITITLSTADAAAHIAENSFVKQLCATDHTWAFLQYRMGVTITLLTILTLVFLKGFKEAVQVAIAVVSAFILLNLGVAVVGCYEVFRSRMRGQPGKSTLLLHSKLRGTWRSDH